MEKSRECVLSQKHCFCVRSSILILTSEPPSSLSLSPEFAPCPQEECGFVVPTQRWFKPHEVPLWHPGLIRLHQVALGLTLYLISDEQFLSLHWTHAHTHTHAHAHTRTHTHTHHMHMISTYSFPHAVLNF